MNLPSFISPRPIGACNRVVRCLRVFLPLIFLLCIFAPPASAQTFTLTVNSVNQLSYEVKVQLSISGTCTQEGTWTINWGDTNTTTPSEADRSSEQSHTYSATGSYTITYSVDCTQFGNAQDITATATIDATTDSPTEVAVAASSGIANWTAFTGATAYILELQVGTTGSISTLRPGTHVTSVNFTVAPNATNCCKNGTAYRARIKVAGSARESEWSDWDDFVFSGTTSFTGTAFQRQHFARLQLERSDFADHHRHKRRHRRNRHERVQNKRTRISLSNGYFFEVCLRRPIPYGQRF